MTSALDGGKWEDSHSVRFTHGDKAPSTYWIGGWVGPRAGLDALEKREISSPAGDPTATVQTITRLYIQTELCRLLHVRVF
jgi:hypothetical protein